MAFVLAYCALGFFAAGWMYGVEYERWRVARNRGTSWRILVGANETLWAERTHPTASLVGPCRDANEIVAAIAEATDPPRALKEG